MDKKLSARFFVAPGPLDAEAGPSAMLVPDRGGADVQMHNEPGQQMYDAQGQTAINDTWLNDMMESTLVFDEYLDSLDIDDGAGNGTVCLSGACRVIH